MSLSLALASASARACQSALVPALVSVSAAASPGAGVGRRQLRSAVEVGVNGCAVSRAGWRFEPGVVVRAISVPSHNLIRLG